MSHNYIDQLALMIEQVFRVEHKEEKVGLFCFRYFNRYHPDVGAIERLKQDIKSSWPDYDAWERGEVDTYSHHPVPFIMNPPEDVVCGVHSFDLINHWFPDKYWSRLRMYGFVIRVFDYPSRHFYTRDDYQVAFYRSKAKLVDTITF